MDRVTLQDRLDAVLVLLLANFLLLLSIALPYGVETGLVLVVVTGIVGYILVVR